MLIKMTSSSPAHLRREWRLALDHSSSVHGVELKAATWNTLHVPNKASETNDYPWATSGVSFASRLPMIISELERSEADVIMLHEVTSLL